MKRFILFLVLSSTLFSFSQSQPFKISGTVKADSSKIPLESATVYLERTKDSTLVTYTISDKNGNFTLEGKTYDKQLNLLISYVGYKTVKKPILINKEEINLESINMLIDNNALDEIIVKSRAPITVKKDTLEFNVKSFKTKKDANVEELDEKVGPEDIPFAQCYLTMVDHENIVLMNTFIMKKEDALDAEKFLLNQMNRIQFSDKPVNFTVEQKKIVEAAKALKK